MSSSLFAVLTVKVTGLPRCACRAAAAWLSVEALPTAVAASVKLLPKFSSCPSVWPSTGTLPPSPALLAADCTRFGRFAMALPSSPGVMVSSLAQLPRVLRLLPPTFERSPDQFSDSVCGPPVTRLELIGRLRLAVPASAVETSEVSGTAPNWACVM